MDWLSESAKTIADAENQQFTVPATYSDWGEFAHLLHGYAIFEEMGVERRYWLTLRREFEAGERDLTVLEARLILFFEARRHHFDPYNQNYVLVNNLLHFIAQKTGQLYMPLTDEQIEQLVKNDIGRSR